MKKKKISVSEEGSLSTISWNSLHLNIHIALGSPFFFFFHLMLVTAFTCAGPKSYSPKIRLNSPLHVTPPCFFFFFFSGFRLCNGQQYYSKQKSVFEVINFPPIY